MKSNNERIDRMLVGLFENKTNNYTSKSDYLVRTYFDRNEQLAEMLIKEAIEGGLIKLIGSSNICLTQKGIDMIENGGYALMRQEKLEENKRIEEKQETRYDLELKQIKLTLESRKYDRLAIWIAIVISVVSLVLSTCKKL